MEATTNLTLQSYYGIPLCSQRERDQLLGIFWEFSQNTQDGASPLTDHQRFTAPRALRKTFHFRFSFGEVVWFSQRNTLFMVLIFSTRIPTRFSNIYSKITNYVLLRHYDVVVQNSVGRSDKRSMKQGSWPHEKPGLFLGPGFPVGEVQHSHILNGTLLCMRYSRSSLAQGYFSFEKLLLHLLLHQCFEDFGSSPEEKSRRPRGVQKCHIDDSFMSPEYTFHRRFTFQEDNWST